MKQYPEGYLEYVKSQLGSKEYRNLIIDNIDYLRDGRGSCAWFVSSVAKSFDLIKEQRGDVLDAIENLKTSGWREVILERVKPGDIIVYGLMGGHYHIGIFIGDDKVISHNSVKRVPIVHDYKFRNFFKVKRERKIIMVLTLL